MDENAPVRVVAEVLVRAIDENIRLIDFYPDTRRVVINVGGREEDFGPPLEEELYRKATARLELMSGANIAAPTDRTRYGRIRFPRWGEEHYFEVYCSISDSGRHVTLKRIPRTP